MEQITCLLFVAALLCAGFAAIGIICALVPERAADYLIYKIFGIKKAADPQRTAKTEK